jgi:phage terminase large subunit GpA-like protein
VQINTPVILSKIEVNSRGRLAGYGLHLVRVNADWCKLWVHERIRWPPDQPGAFHLPEDVTDDYCAQLISEVRIRKPSGRATWLQRSRENHCLDCEALAYAAGYLLNVQRIHETPDIHDTARRTPADKEMTKEPVPNRSGSKPVTRLPNVIRSSYLMRR